MFYCTKLDWMLRQILSAYACRWAIECTFENCKQFLGLEDPANRLPKAVARTALMALFIYTLVVVWSPPDGLSIAPLSVWLGTPKKEEPSFADMLTTLDSSVTRKKPHNRFQNSLAENLDRPAHRASQPNRVSDTSAEDPASSTSSRSIRRGVFTRRAARDPPPNLRNENIVPRQGSSACCCILTDVPARETHRIPSLALRVGI